MTIGSTNGSRVGGRHLLRNRAERGWCYPRPRHGREAACQSAQAARRSRGRRAAVAREALAGRRRGRRAARRSGSAPSRPLLGSSAVGERRTQGLRAALEARAGLHAPGRSRRLAACTRSRPGSATRAWNTDPRRRPARTTSSPAVSASTTSPSRWHGSCTTSSTAACTCSTAEGRRRTRPSSSCGRSTTATREARSWRRSTGWATRSPSAPWTSPDAGRRSELGTGSSREVHRRRRRTRSKAFLRRVSAARWPRGRLSLDQLQLRRST